MTIKTPIRYPGGKSRMVKYLDSFIPESSLWDEYREPFIGGASMFLWTKQKYPNKKFWINDKYYNLYCFWVALRDHCQDIVKIITSLKKEYPNKESGRNLFNLCNNNLKNNNRSLIEIAADFYIVNKTSFSGLTQDSCYAPQAYDQNFGWRTIEKFPLISNLLQDVKITNIDYSELLEDSEKTFLYLDPPYDIKYCLYGGNKGSLHKGFDHLSLCDNLKKIKTSKWLLSYNENEQIKSLYSEYYQNTSYLGKYTMNCPRTEIDGKKKSKGNSEIIIKNY